MRTLKLKLIGIALLGTYFSIGQCESDGSGNWNSISWSGCSSATPIKESVTIKSGHSVTIPNNYNQDFNGKLTVESGAVLQWNDAKSSWTGDWAIDGIMQVNSNLQDDPSFTGDVTVTGTLQLNATSSFLGDMTVDGASAILAINKATDVAGNVLVDNGAKLDIEQKFAVGSGAGCGYTVTIEDGGYIDQANAASDLISICGNTILSGNGTCNDLYTEPGDGPVFCLGDYDVTGNYVFNENGIGFSPLKVAFSSIEYNEGYLSWSTSYESSSDYFKVLGSYDGQSFEEIAEVKSANAIDGESYELEVGLVYNYYQVVEMDFDQTRTESRIVTGIVDGMFSYYPNPASSILYYTSSEFLQLELYNIHGEVVLGQENFNEGIVELNGLNPGYYYIISANNGDLKTYPLTIE